MMSQLEFVNSDICQRLTLTLLHMLWVGTAIAVVTVAACQCLKRASARARYMMNLAALVLMLVCLPTIFALVAVNQSGGSTGVVSGIETPRAGHFNSVSASTSRADIVRMREVTASTSHDGSGLKRIAPYATAVYLTGLVFLLTRLALLFGASGRTRRLSSPLEDRQILSMLHQQARKIGLRRIPAIAWSQQVAVPSIMGIQRPVILLPASLATGLGPDELQAIVIHELAHLRRYDPLVHLFQRIAESLLFFHPFVWFISRRVSIEREICCDDAVVASGWKPVDYANALVRMAELCAVNGTGNIASRATMLAATGNTPSQFKRRVLRLLGSGEESNLRLSRPASLAVLVTAAAVVLVLALPPVSESIGDDVRPANPDSKMSATELEPGESIYNDKLRRFKFRIDNMGVIGPETVQAFMSVYNDSRRGVKNPEIIGALPDPLTDSLIVIGPPEAEQAIRTCLARWQVELVGITDQEMSLDVQKKFLEHRRKTLIEEITSIELAAVEVADDDQRVRQLTERVAAFQTELEIVERKFAVVEKNKARLKSDPLRSPANYSGRRSNNISRPTSPRPLDVRGLVLTDADEKLKQVEISIGSDDGLKSGDILFAYRGKTRLAAMVVLEMTPDRAVARIVTDFEGRLRKADRVTSRIENFSTPSGSLKSDGKKS